MIGLAKLAGVTLDIKPGDILLGGRFQNKRIEIKEMGTNELGQPTVNGRSLLRYRIEKLLPEDKKSSQTIEESKKEAGWGNPYLAEYFNLLGS